MAQALARLAYLAVYSIAAPGIGFAFESFNRDCRRHIAQPFHSCGGFVVDQGSIGVDEKVLIRMSLREV